MDADTDTWIVADRRTGKQVAEKKFKAPFPKCPRGIVDNQSADSNSVDSAKVKRRLASFVAKGT